jgi:hypothetical protein
MSGISKSGNRVHDDQMSAAESVRQGVVRAPGVSHATVRTAEIAFYRAAISSAMANGLPHAQFGAALRDLGTGGV